MLEVLALQTVMLAVPAVTDPDAAEIVADPGATPETVPPVSTVATAVLLDDQVAVTCPVLPSLKVPVAIKWTVHGRPATGAEHGEIEAVAGVTEMAVNVGLMKNPLQPTANTNASVARVTPRLDRR